MTLAYIDPGSGALVWQILVAAIMGFLFYLGKVRAFIWRGITSLFRIGAKPSEAQRQDESGKD